MSEGKKSKWRFLREVWEAGVQGWKEAGTFPETDNVDHGVYTQKNDAANEAECEFFPQPEVSPINYDNPYRENFIIND